MARIVHIPLAAQAVMPWANGGGSTRQVAIDPPDGSLAHGFRWRVSIAQVDVDGPFSRLPGIDRSLWLLRGGGVRLDVDGREVVLARPLERFDFAGETPIVARLLAGPIEDLNLMVARDRVRAVADVALVDAGSREYGTAPERLLVVLAGSVTTATGLCVRCGDALHIVGDEGLWLHAASPATVLEVRLREREGATRRPAVA